MTQGAGVRTGIDARNLAALPFPPSPVPASVLANDRSREG